MKMVYLPNNPQGRVEKALVSWQANCEILTALEKRDVSLIKVKDCGSLEKPVASHADLLYHHLGGNRIVSGNPDDDSAEIIKALGFDIIKTEKRISSPYPADVALDAARVGRRLICNRGFTDKSLIEYCACHEIAIIDVKQGYAKCSVCIVDECSIITADSGIAVAAESNGISVLRITGGYISLPGYGSGFFGGCCGKIAPDIMAFAGDLKTHPDHKKIEDFMNARGVFAESLCAGPLCDIGGIIPLTEY